MPKSGSGAAKSASEGEGRRADRPAAAPTWRRAIRPGGQPPWRRASPDGPPQAATAFRDRTRAGRLAPLFAGDGAAPRILCLLRFLRRAARARRLAMPATDRSNEPLIRVQSAGLGRGSERVVRAGRLRPPATRGRGRPPAGPTRMASGPAGPVRSAICAGRRRGPSTRMSPPSPSSRTAAWPTRPGGPVGPGPHCAGRLTRWAARAPQSRRCFCPSPVPYGPPAYYGDRATYGGRRCHGV